MEKDKVYISQEILKRLGIKFKLDRIKQNISCWEHKDKNPSLSINLEKGIYHCFSCGSSGLLTNKYWNTFHRSIYRDLNLTPDQVDLLKPTDLERRIDFSQDPETDFIFEGRIFRNGIGITDAGKIWIKQRGFSEEILKDFKSSYVQFGIFKQKSDPTNKKEWVYVINRALFPIIENKNIISYELRDIMGKTHYEKQLQKKNLSIEDYPYKKLLYPRNSSVNTLYDLDKLNREEPLYIVEGLMDLISLRTNSLFKNSSCLFHCIPSERQLFFLEKFKKIIYIVNNDLPGYMGCKKLMERNKNTSFLCVPLTVKDVNDILQKRDKRFSTIEDLIKPPYNWLSNINSSIENLNIKISELESTNEKV